MRRILLTHALTAAVAHMAKEAAEDAETVVIRSAPEPRFCVAEDLHRPEPAWKQKSRPKAGHKNGKRARKRK